MAAPGWAATTAAGRYTSPHPAAPPQHQKAAVQSVCCTFDPHLLTQAIFIQMTNYSFQGGTAPQDHLNIKLTDLAEPVVRLYDSYFERAELPKTSLWKGPANV